MTDDRMTLIELVEKQAAGWHRAEIGTAILSLVAADMRAHAGSDATDAAPEAARVAISGADTGSGGRP